MKSTVVGVTLLIGEDAMDYGVPGFILAGIRDRLKRMVLKDQKWRRGFMKDYYRSALQSLDDEFIAIVKS